MFNDSHFRQGGTTPGCFPVGGWLTTPTSPPVYGPGLLFGDVISQQNTMSEQYGCLMAGSLNSTILVFTCRPIMYYMFIDRPIGL